MAENKKSFILYADLMHTVSKMPDNKAGELLKHILLYVNDRHPETDDLIIQLTFEPIKQQLKRDLKKYGNKKGERSRAGILGNLKRYQKDLYDAVISEVMDLEEAQKVAKGRIAIHSDTKLAVNVSVNDSVSVNDIKTTKAIKDIDVVYTVVEFLKNWNDLRTEHLKKPSFLNRLSHDDLLNFNDLAKDYKGEDFNYALIGLFKQKKLPNGNTSMQSNPKHFLTHFNSYLTAFHDKNSSLYGKQETNLQTL